MYNSNEAITHFYISISAVQRHQILHHISEIRNFIQLWFISLLMLFSLLWRQKKEQFKHLGDKAIWNVSFSFRHSHRSNIAVFDHTGNEDDATDDQVSGSMCHNGSEFKVAMIGRRSEIIIWHGPFTMKCMVKVAPCTSWSGN